MSSLFTCTFTTTLCTKGCKLNLKRKSRLTLVKPSSSSRKNAKQYKKVSSLSDESDSMYIVTGTRNAPESFTGERKREYDDKKKKNPPIIIMIIVSCKISAILPTCTHTLPRILHSSWTLNPSYKRSLAKYCEKGEHHAVVVESPSGAVKNLLAGFRTYTYSYNHIYIHLRSIHTLTHTQ